MLMFISFPAIVDDWIEFCLPEHSFASTGGVYNPTDYRFPHISSPKKISAVNPMKLCKVKGRYDKIVIIQKNEKNGNYLKREIGCVLKTKLHL